MHWKTQLNDSATLNRHTHPSRCSQMLPYSLGAKQCTLSCSEITSLVLLNILNVVEESIRISSIMYSRLQHATKWNHYDVTISEQFGLLAAFRRLFRCISNLKPYFPGLIIIMFISNNKIQFAIFLQRTLIQALQLNIQCSMYLNPHNYLHVICYWFFLMQHSVAPNVPV